MGYSTTVAIRLIQPNGQSFEVAQVGEEFFRLAEPRMISAGDMELEIVIDGDAKRWPIHIDGSDGISRMVYYKDRQ